MVLKKYGVETTIYFPLITRGAIDFKVGAAWVAGDSTISKDGGNWANTATFTEVNGGGVYGIVLTAVQMQAAEIVVRIIDQTSPKVWEDQAVQVQTYGHASAAMPFDLGTALQTVDVLQISGSANAADALELLALNAKGADHKVLISTDAQSLAATLHVDAGAISADAAAADSLELLVENCKGTDHKVLLSADAQDLSGTLHVDAKAVSGDATAADNLEEFTEHALGTDNKVLISGDTQHLDDTLHVMVGSVDGSQPAATALKNIVNNSEGADHKLLLSSDDQDLSGTLHVDAGAISDDPGTADRLQLGLDANGRVELQPDGLDAVSVVEPAGIPVGFAQGLYEAARRILHLNKMVVQKTGEGEGELKFYKRDGNTIAFTADIIEDASAQAVNGAS